jgi:hypothetical protein
MNNRIKIPIMKNFIFIDIPLFCWLVWEKTHFIASGRFKKTMSRPLRVL